MEAWFDDRGGGVIRGEEEDVASCGGCAVGKRSATRDAGGEGEGEERGVAAGGGVEKGEVSEGDTSGPEPGERGGGDVGEQKTGWQGRGSWVGWDRGDKCVWEGVMVGKMVLVGGEGVQEVVAEGFEGHWCDSFWVEG